MKRIFSFIAACATMFALAACQEELQQPVEQPVIPGVEGELQEVTFSVSVPQDPQTKAISDGMKATNLEYAVYRAEAYSYTDEAGKTETYPAGEYIPALSQGANAKVTEMHDSDQLKWEVVLTLAKNVKYDIVFWAYADDAPYTFDEEKATITVNDNYTGPANAENRDAFFFRCDDYAVITSDTKVELRRPFAQINFGSSDYDPYIKDLHLKMTSTFDTDAHAPKDAVYENDDPNGRLLYPAVPAVGATKLPTVLNVLDGTVSGEAVVKFDTTPIPYETGDQVLMVTDADGDETTTADQTTYHWMAMNYVLAGEEATIDNIHAVFTYNNQDLEINVPNVPFKRNYKTNIIGNLFTGESKFNVVVVPDYYEPDYIYDMDLTLAEAFTQNRDVEFTLTEDTVIEEPLILENGKTLTLNLDEYSITTETDLWDTAEKVWSMISVRNGSTLVINSEGGKVVAKANDAYAIDVQDGSTVTINGGEYVGNISSVYVLYGTANINGGSYSIQQLAEPANGGDERFTLNCEDAAYRAGDAVINVTGGSFVNFDPSNNLAEGAGTDFLADGYVAVPSEVEGKTVYTVKKNAVLAAVAAGNDAVTIEGTEEFVKPVIIESGKTFTLTLGEEAVLASHNADPDTYASVFEVHGELVINGNGKVDAGEGAASNIAVWARGEGAKITINGGYFTNGADAAANASPVIYASKKDAQIIINGGTFEAGAQSPSDFSKPTYPVLNLYDSAAADGAMITVYGGTFINFDPSNPGTEVAAWNTAHPNGFVADGYTVESEEKDGKMYYTVVEKKGSSVISLADFLAAQVSANDWYQLTGMITKVVNTTYGNFYIQDENGTEVYVYGLTETQVEKNDKTYANLGLEVGDVVTFNSLRSEHNGAAQAGGNTPAYYISHTDAVVTYGIVGTLNGWGSTDDIKMASIYDKYHVAYDINMTTQDAFKIRTINDVNWSTSIGVNNNGQDGAFMPDAGFAAFVDGGSKNISVLKDGKYDVYYKDGNIYILSSGKTPEDITTLSTPVEPELKRADENTAAPGITLADLCVAGSFNGWSDTDMTLDGDWYVSPALELNGNVEFKFKEKNSWDKTLGGEYYRQAFVGNEYPTTGGNNIKAYGLEGSYCIYLAKDQSRFKIEKYVAPGSEQIIDLTGEWTLGENAYDGSSSSKQTAVINGTTYTDIIKLGTSSKYGTVTFTLPAGTTKLMFSAVAWKGNACSLKFTIGSSEYTQLINANTGATGNPQYVITTSDADNYVIDVSLDEDTEVTLTTVNKPRAIIWDLKAVVTK